MWTLRLYRLEELDKELFRAFGKKRIGSIIWQAEPQAELIGPNGQHIIGRENILQFLSN